MAEPAYLTMLIDAAPLLGPEPPPANDAEVAGAGGGGGAARAKPPGGRAKRAHRPPAVNSGALVMLMRDFAYQYGSEVAWDCDRREPIRISHLTG